MITYEELFKIILTIVVLCIILHYISKIIVEVKLKDHFNHYSIKEVSGIIKKKLDKENKKVEKLKNKK